MAIRVNLLAEALAAEEMRRKDPVKRAIWIGALLVVLMLVWSSSVMLNAMLRKAEVARVESQMTSLEQEYKVVLDSQKTYLDNKSKLEALARLSANRLLYGEVLNALQQVNVPDVHLTKVQTRHEYRLTAEVKPKKEGGSTRTTPGKPATMTELLVITIEGRDNSDQLDQALAYRKAINDYPYFRSLLTRAGRTNEARLSGLPPTQTDPRGQVFQPFTLICELPAQTR